MENNFLPMLLDVDASCNYLSEGDALWLTTRWQNTGTQPAHQNLKCFLDLEFGYQRTVEDISKSQRHIVEILPGLQYLEPAAIMPVSLCYKIPSVWAGTYNLFIGFCDEDTNPIDIVGKDGKRVKRIALGSIEISWGWGKTALDLIKGPWSEKFNDALPVNSTKTQCGVIEIKDGITVRLSNNEPSVIGYESKDFCFDFESKKPEIVVRDYKNDRPYFSYEEWVRVEYLEPDVDENMAAYTGRVFVNDTQAAEFKIHFTVNKNILTIEYDSIEEKNGFEFIELRLYSLCALGGENSNLVDVWCGGRLVPVSKARQIGYTKLYDVRNASALYNENGMAIMESFCLDDKIFISVEGENQTKRGVLGSTLAAKVIARKHLKSIDVPKGRIEIAVFNKDEMKPDWMSYAKYLRKDLKGKNNNIHRQALHGEMYCSQGPEPWPWQITEDSPWSVTRINKGIKLKDMINEVKKIYNVLDGYKVIPFIYGYHKQNSEDHTPSWQPYEGDKRAGTPEDFKQLVEDAKKYNTLICLYENYDHVWKSGVTDAKYSAMDMYGEPWKGWTWADGVTIEVGYKKYVESGEMQKRIKKMMEIWGPRETGYIDVLSSEVLRWDFDPDCPGSAQTNLKYRQEVINEYNKYGVDIFSETLVNPWVGVSSYGHGTRIYRKASIFESDRYIPLMNAIYHGTIGYNGADCGMSKSDFFSSLEDAGGLKIWVDEPVTYDFVKWVYLYQMPMGLLFDEKLEDYIEKDGKKSLIYSNNCAVYIEEEKTEYEIIFNGLTVGKNFTSFVESTKGDGWLAYSLNGGEMRYKAPKEFLNKKLDAFVINLDGVSDEKVEVRLENDEIVINMPEKKPVKVTVCKEI